MRAVKLGDVERDLAKVPPKAVEPECISVDRASCPCPKASREAFLGDVIARANAILHPPIATVTVKSGDTLSGIATAHKLTLAALPAFSENARDRANPGLIDPDDVVRLK